MKEKNLEQIDIIISQADLNGNIIYINKVFCKVSGYDCDFLIGKRHNILKDEKMPKAIFKFLWENLKRKEDVYCFIKNRTKDGDFYWIFSHIYPSLNSDKTVRNYISISYPISQKAKEIVTDLYNNLKLVEERKGVEASFSLFREFIEINRYRRVQRDNEVMYSIQY